MYVIYDTFNKNIISRHRTIEGAVKGKRKFFRRFYENNTQSSYLPTALMVERNGDLTDASESDRNKFARIECCD